MIRETYENLLRLSSFPHAALNELIASRLLSRNPPLSPYRNLRLAFVKQEVTPGFYCTPPQATARELLETCFKHLGPLALSTRLQADFPILKTTDDPETQVWKEVVTDAKHGRLEDYEIWKTKPFLDGARGHTKAPGELAVPPESIDWGKYDIVISANISIPTAVLKRYPGTTWAYFCDPPVTTHYRRSQKEPLYGYDLFLNLRYRTLRTLPKPNAPHVIDWPFDLLSSGSIAEALGEPLPATRRGIFIESHSRKLLSDMQIARLESFGPLYQISPRTIDIARDLLKAKYYVRLGGRLLWGNPQIEGIAAGCLFVADPREFLNKSLFTRATSVRSFENLVKRLETFEAAPDLYEAERKKQAALLDHFCFHRPLNDLWEKHLAVQKKRGVR